MTNQSAIIKLNRELCIVGYLSSTSPHATTHGKTSAKTLSAYRWTVCMCTWWEGGEGGEREEGRRGGREEEKGEREIRSQMCSKEVKFLILHLGLFGQFSNRSFRD